MVYFCLCIFLLLPRLVVMSDISVAPAPAVWAAYTPTDNILINCGSPIKDASLDGREWDTESSPPIFTSSPYIFNTSTATFRAVDRSNSVDEIPYSTARIFSSKRRRPSNRKMFSTGVIMQDLPHEQMNLAEWSRNCYRNANLGEIADKNLTGEIAAESLNKFGEVAYSCLRDHGMDRHTMSEVVWSLEFALQLQETHDKSDHGNLFLTKSVAQTTSGEPSTSSTSSDGFKSGIGSVFSDILNPNAR